MDAEDATLVSTHRYDNGDLGLVIRGPGWGWEWGAEQVPVPELAEEGLVERARDLVGEAKIVSLHIYHVNVRADTLRCLFGEFPHLEQVGLHHVNCVDEDLGVLMPQVMRKPLTYLDMFRCTPVRAGLRGLLQFAESAPGMRDLRVVAIGRAWEKEEALFAARLVETHRSVRFRFGLDACAPMQAALDRAAERARLPTFKCARTHDIARPYNIARGRNCVLTLLLLLLPPSADAPLSRLLRKDGDHAIAIRILAMIGGDVVFDATTAEQAYDACVLRMEGGVE